MYWERDEIKKLLHGLGTLTETKPGGDWDLTGLDIQPPGSILLIDNVPVPEVVSIIPYTDPSKDPIPEDDNCDVMAVEVRASNGSDGGLYTENEDIGKAYGTAVARLTKMGFCVIRHCDQIF